MLNELKALDWKEITKKSSFWISMGLFAIAISIGMTSCFNSFARTEEARYKHNSEIHKNHSEMLKKD